MHCIFARTFLVCEDILVEPISFRFNFIYFFRMRRHSLHFNPIFLKKETTYFCHFCWLTEKRREIQFRSFLVHLWLHFIFILFCFSLSLCNLCPSMQSTISPSRNTCRKIQTNEMTISFSLSVRFYFNFSFFSLFLLVYPFVYCAH